MLAGMMTAGLASGPRILALVNPETSAQLSPAVWVAGLFGIVAVAVSAVAYMRLRAAARQVAALATRERELAEARAAQHTAEETFRSFMENGPLHCWIVDREGRFRFANRVYEESANAGGDLRGKHLRDVFSAGLAERFHESDLAVLRRGRAYGLPEVIRVGDREHEVYKFPVEGANGEMLVGGLSLDVTDTRATHDALRQNSQLLTVVSDALRAYLDGADWKKAYALLLRCAIEQTRSECGIIGVMVPGPKLRILAHQGVRWEEHLGREQYDQAMKALEEGGCFDFPSLDSPLGRVIASGISAGVATSVAEAGAAAGGLRSYLTVAVRHENQVVGLVAVANREGSYDAGAQAQLEMLVQQAGVLCDTYRRSLREASLEEQVRVAQKMEAVGLLAGGVAHDFNNLLQVIQGYTSMALDSAAPWPERRMSLEQVKTAGDRAAQLTQQLLAFGRQQTLQKGDVDLNHAVSDLLRMIRRVIGEQITVDFIPGHDLGNIHADRAQIDQVLLNLCLNSRDALPEGGRITIETENVLVNGSFRESHPWAKPGRYVLISVTDNGVGMDKETISRVFEPFFSTKPKGKGTGLGLAVVYGVIKQHDGLVHVYSEPGKGTTFKIYLPIVERTASSVGPKHTPSQTRGSETILIAEDETMVRDLAQRILARAGYRVIAAKDGAEACALYAQHAAEIALAMLDVVMPQLGGRETYARLVLQRPNLPVIFCSGYAGSALDSEALAPGARLLAKPYGADELLESVRQALDARPPR